MCDALDNCQQTPNAGQQNADGDLRGDACDCSSSNPAVWSIPSSVQEQLQGSEPTSIIWSAPVDPGGTQTVTFDVLRSIDRYRFGPNETFVVCIASDITGLAASDQLPGPPPGTGFYYLVRSSNDCGGNMGTRSEGDPRPPGRSCP